MNVRKRLDELAKALKLPTNPNIFTTYTDEQLEQFVNQTAATIQATIDKDPEAVSKYDPDLIKILKHMRLINV